LVNTYFVYSDEDDDNDDDGDDDVDCGSWHPLKHVIIVWD
jgi:hypothetical protein